MNIGAPSIPTYQPRRRKKGGNKKKRKRRVGTLPPVRRGKMKKTVSPNRGKRRFRNVNPGANVNSQSGQYTKRRVIQPKDPDRRVAPNMWQGREFAPMTPHIMGNLGPDRDLPPRKKPKKTPVYGPWEKPADWPGKEKKKKKGKKKRGFIIGPEPILWAPYNDFRLKPKRQLWKPNGRKNKRRRQRRRRTYYPRSYSYPRTYRRVVRSSGGGGGGSLGKEYERYGITPRWMEAYKKVWGHALPEKFWGVYEPAVQLFTKYTGRMPQLYDWERIWRDMMARAEAEGTDIKNMWRDISLYDPYFVTWKRPPLFTPPDITYSQQLNF